MFDMIFYTSLYMVFLLSMFVILKVAAKPNGNILLGVTLPYDALNDSRTLEIINKYRRACRFVVLVFLLFAIPVPLFANYPSLNMIYLLVSCFAMGYFCKELFSKHFSELYSLKRENEWWVGEQNIISIDTEVSRLKDTFLLSRKWFILPFALSLLPAIHGLTANLTEIQFWVMVGAGMLNVMAVFLIYHMVKNMKTKTYSESTEINIALNHVFRREWSKCLIIMATLTSILHTTLSFFIALGTLGEIVTLTFTALVTLAILIPVFLSFNKIREARNRILLLENETVYTDDDQYWKSGLYYNNPNDSNTFVEKRVGLGMTVNVATKGGKLLLAMAIPAVALWLGLAIYMLPFDFGSVNLEISGQTATITAPLNRFSFSADEIIDVSLLDTMPPAGRVNHVSHGRIISGVSNVTGYGESHVFVLRENAPYIRVELASGWVFVNGGTHGETMSFFDALVVLR